MLHRIPKLHMTKALVLVFVNVIWLCLMAYSVSLSASANNTPQSKPVIKAKYQPETQSKRQEMLFPTLEQVNEQNQDASLSPVGVATQSGSLPKEVVLDNNYPLPKVSAPTKKKLKATYSEHGIVSDLGVEKRRVYQYEKNGVMAFSDHQPDHNNYQILLYECFACRPDSTIDWYKIPLFTSEYTYYVEQAASLYGLEPALIRAVIHAESAFRSNVVSKAGAKGLMQLMPGTAKDMQVSDVFNPRQNIMGGSRYLAKLLAEFNGSVDLACAAYNAGPTTVREYNGVPNYPETQAYVQRVKILYSRYRKAS